MQWGCGQACIFSASVGYNVGPRKNFRVEVFKTIGEREEKLNNNKKTNTSQIIEGRDPPASYAATAPGSFTFFKPNLTKAESPELNFLNLLRN